MSIELPFVNYRYNTSGALRFDIPSAGAQKPANTAFALGLWIRCPAAAFQQTRVHTFLGRQGANTSGNDGYIRFTSNSAGAIECLIRSSSTVRFNQTLALGASAYDKPMLVMLIADSTASHLVVCEPGSAPLIATQADNQLYAVAMTTTPFMQRLGSAAVHGFYGAIENYFFIHGGFPMVTGAPDTTLVQAVADGSQDLDTLHSLMAGGTRQCRYKMPHARDISDAWGLSGDLVKVNENKPTGHTFRSSGPLRPVALRPARARAMLSQLTCATRGDFTTAATAIKTEGGAYVGISPAKIQGRLVKEDGSPHVNWTDLDAAPSGGWAASQFAGVGPVAGFLELELRAVDGTGAQIGESVFSHGLRGTSAAVYVSEGQSQLIHNWASGSLALPDGINILTTEQNGGAAPAGQTVEAIVSSGCETNIILGWGMRQAAIEVNTLYPGLPIHFMTVGESGEPLNDWAAGGLYVGRWANLAAHLGVIEPHLQLHYGHSNVPSADANAYELLIADVVAQKEAALGAALRVIHVGTPRYSGLVGTGGNYGYVDIARRGARQWVRNNPAKGYWAPSFHVVETGQEGNPANIDPHPAVTDGGQGRSGALQVWSVLMAAGIVADEPLSIISAAAVGTTVKLTIGPINI